MMRNIFSLTAKNDSVEDHAAMWVARRDGGPLSDDEQSRFEAWRDAEVGHQAAYDALDKAWGEMGDLAALLGPAHAGERPDPDILTKKFGQLTPRSHAREAMMAIAATVLLFVGVGWFAMGPLQDENTHTTDVGEVRTVALEDGSEIILNTDTRLSVHFDEHQRLVELASGEAYFKIAKDPQRPFLVAAGRGEIKAIGTEFNVHFEDDLVEVVVAKGVVEVVMPDKDRPQADVPPSQRMVLTKNQTTGFDGHLRKSSDIDSRQLKRLLSWQNRKLEFDNESLANVVQEIERYTNKRIFFASDNLKNLRIGGVYEIGDVDSLVEALQDFFPIRAVHVTHYVTILVSTDDAKLDRAAVL